MPIEFEKREGQSEDFRTFLEDVKQTERWREHLRVVRLDSRLVVMRPWMAFQLLMEIRIQGCWPMPSSCR
jgi:hypothetical protein